MHPIWGLHGPAAARTPGNGQQTWYRSAGNYKNGPRWPSGQADCYGLRMFGFPYKMKERVVHPKSWNPQFQSIGIGHQIQPAIGVGLRLQPIPESRSPPPVPLYIHARTPPSVASTNRSIRRHVVVAVRRRARRCRLCPGPGNNVTAAARASSSSTSSSGTSIVPPQCCHCRQECKRRASSWTSSWDWTATAAPHLYRGAATAAAAEDTVR